MNPTTGAQPTDYTRPNRKWLLIPVLLVLVAFVAGGGCPLNALVPNDVSPWTEPVTRPWPKRHTLDIQRAGNILQVTVGSPGPPHPDHVLLTWAAPAEVAESSIQISHQQYATTGDRSVVVWKLPVNPATGKTDTVTMSYDSPPGGSTVVDHFEVYSYVYNEPTVENVTHQIPGGSDRAALQLRPGPAWTPPDRDTTASQKADYYVWQVEWELHGPTDVAMTAELCQDWKGFLQGGHTFAALRFPVQPPTLAPTAPYTLPIISGGNYTPTLTLLDESGGWPPTPIISMPLEYKPQYHTFLENELPAAPGEHWLALGVVTTPAIDCAGIPNLDRWGLGMLAWLDLGGGKNTCTDCVLPLYYCYEGQVPPAPAAMLQGMAGWDTASYQGWGITCLGPQPLRLNPTVPTLPFVLEEMHTAWVSPTQTITFGHHLANVSGVPVTVTVSHSSTLGLPWGIYSGTSEGPDIPLVPITDPIRLEPVAGPGSVRFLWLIADVPADTPSGAETLFITATDVTSPAHSVWVSDLVWVGDWVAPPGPPLWYRLYLPLVLRESP